jgi:hypothetical protein
MNIALVDVDSHNFPNLALAKLSAYHKAKGDHVEWYSPLFSNPDVIYASKVFTYTPDYINYAPNHMDKIIKGGTGYNVQSKLPEEVEKTLPDLELYPNYKFSYGFLTRGCINKCPWCVVPRKEGDIKIVDTLERVSQGRKEVILLDNNFLAVPRDFVVSTLNYAIDHKLKLDFNQNLDCRLVTKEYASLLSKVKWIKYLRFVCDHQGQIEPLRQSINLMRNAGYNGEIFVILLAKEFNETYKRLKQVLAMDNKVVPFLQEFKDYTSDVTVTDEIAKLSRWCNRAWIRKKCSFEEYQKKVIEEDNNLF